MHARNAAAALLGLSLLAPCAAGAAWIPGEASHAMPKVQAREAAPLAVETSAMVVLPPLSSDAEKSLPASAPGGAQRIGIGREVAPAAWTAAERSLRWQAAPGGALAARLSVRSPQAAALRVALALRGAPAGTRLRFSGQALEAAPIEMSAGESAAFWGPVTAGEEQSIEVELAPGADPAAVRLSLEGISHLLADPAAAAPALPGAKAGAASCHQDVACVPPSEALLKAMRSVAKIVYTVNGSTYSCTGTLVNDTEAATQIPYLLTARHCVDSPAAAASVNTFWFLEAAACGAKSATNPTQLAGGARLLHAGTMSDIALLRLNEPAPAGAWFSGLDAAAPAEGEAAIALHHPAGDLKKLSSGRVVGAAEGASGRLVALAWLAGSTEAGSSGSALFTERGGQYVVRATLRGGSASCSNAGRLDDPANRDYYERLDADLAAIEKHLHAPAAPLEDYTDLWIVAGQPGTGISITQHPSNATFVVWFHYDRQGQPAWITMPGGTWTAANTFTGTLYRTRRPEAAVGTEAVGAGTLTFTGRGQATLAYTLDGSSDRIILERLAF